MQKEHMPKPHKSVRCQLESRVTKRIVRQHEKHVGKCEYTTNLKSVEVKKYLYYGSRAPAYHVTRVMLEVARLLPVDGGALVEVVALFAAAAAAASSSSSDPLWLLPDRLDESLEWLHSVRAS